LEVGNIFCQLIDHIVRQIEPKRLPDIFALFIRLHIIPEQRRAESEWHLHEQRHHEWKPELLRLKLIGRSGKVQPAEPQRGHCCNIDRKETADDSYGNSPQQHQHQMRQHVQWLDRLVVQNIQQCSRRDFYSSYEDTIGFGKDRVETILSLSQQHFRQT